MNWKSTNKLTINTLRISIRAGKQTCAAEGCDRKATDAHHLDYNHSNNEPLSLAPACKLCHNTEHNITADMGELKLLTREFYAVQNHRRALSNRIGAYERLDLPITYACQALKDIEDTEAKLKNYIVVMLKANHFYNTWLKHVKGLGPLLSASLMSGLGSPERFNTVGQLWAYCGEHVVDGEAPRRKKGQRANWNGSLRMTLFKVSSSFVKYDCFGRQLYNQYKDYYINRDGPDPKWKPHKRAMRRVAKDFVRCLWLAWMDSRNLPTGQAHTETKVFPNHWIEQLA